MPDYQLRPKQTETRSWRLDRLTNEPYRKIDRHELTCSRKEIPKISAMGMAVRGRVDGVVQIVLGLELIE